MQAHLGVEVPFGGQQVAHVAFGQHHQPGELGVVQVGDAAVALQVVVALHQRAQFVVGAFDADVEGAGGGGLATGLAGTGLRRGCLPGVGVRQQGAAGQRQQRPPQGQQPAAPAKKIDHAKHHRAEFSGRAAAAGPTWRARGWGLAPAIG